jgi:hypothetical protein
MTRSNDRGRRWAPRLTVFNAGGQDLDGSYVLYHDI